MAGVFDLPGTGRREVGRASGGSGTRSRRAGAGVYGNFAMRPTDRSSAKMYPPETITRLAAVKREWDPQNLFSRNHNVAPA